MEWVETTGKTIEAAREAALDQLGVAADEAEFDVIEEPRPGLFGRVRGEARLRARVRPAQVRPKQERRRRGKGESPAPASPGDDPINGADVSDGATDASPAGEIHVRFEVRFQVRFQRQAQAEPTACCHPHTR